ncbi:hypothetical protein ABZP36_036124 [Zizania latifolia]
MHASSNHAQHQHSRSPVVAKPPPARLLPRTASPFFLPEPSAAALTAPEGGLIFAGACSGPGVASAASKRRAPPPAPAAAEKKDPNVSGVQAKVLASKKRKEAMKEFVAKVREKGKPVN